MRRSTFAPLLAVLFVAVGSAHADVVKVQCPPALAPFLSAAATALREKVELKIFAEGGSSQAIAAVGSDAVQAGVVARAFTSEDRAAFPAKRFEELHLGWQTFAIVVPRDVWEAGVKTLSKEQMTAIYEKRLRNWKDLGGEDRPIKFFQPQQGLGAWEQMAIWLYGDVRRAPLGDFPIVANATDARDSVEFNAGSISILPPQLADGKGIFPLGLKLPDGKVAQPTAADVGAGKFPMARSVSLIAGDRPTGDLHKTFDFFASPEGRSLAEKNGIIPPAAPSN